MKRNLAKVLAAVMLVGGMTVNVNAVDNPYTGGDSKNINTKDDAENTAHAGEVENSSGNTLEKEIIVNFKNTTNSGIIHVYALSVDKSEVEFSYNSSANLVWNPKDLKYESTNEEGSWSSNTQSITVTNYSDIDVTVDPGIFNQVSENGNISVTLGGKIDLKSAYNQNGENQPTHGAISVTLTGEPEGVYPDLTSLGTFTLKVTKTVAG